MQPMPHAETEVQNALYWAYCLHLLGQHFNIFRLKAFLKKMPAILLWQITQEDHSRLMFLTPDSHLKSMGLSFELYIGVHIPSSINSVGAS